MMFIKKSMLCILLLSGTLIQAQKEPKQRLELENAYDLAIANYPKIQNLQLVEQLEELRLENIGKDKLPTITLNGQGQLQSENVSIGSPGTQPFIEAPLETFNVNLDIDYQLYNGGLTRASRKNQLAQSAVDLQATRVELDNLKERVNTLFFVISLSRKRNSIIELSLQDLKSNIESTQAAYNNGAALESDVSKLKVRELELQSEQIQLQSSIQSSIAVLELLIGQNLDKDVVLILPDSILVSSNFEVDVPELELYNRQSELIASQEDIINAQRKPVISLYAQGGVGYPNPLNFSDINTATYALGGVRLRWEILDWGKSQKEKEILDLQQNQIEVERETFLFEVSTKREDLATQINNLNLQIANNEEIVALQNEILKQTSVQLDNGVINTTDYITQLNATLSASQELELSRVQLQETTIEYLTLIGKL